ncbi:MAG: dihydrofolate reductase family protein [Glaciimonas sp.]|nr:dihydrofolate reductase family protein [Glaciimonas sp.]
MRKVKLVMQISVDGFSADAEGTPNWMVWPWSDDWKWDNRLRQYYIDLTTSSDCILLSRKMAEEGFHSHWEKLTQNPADPQYAFAKPITEMRKLVFTKTLNESVWKNTELVKGDSKNEIDRLKSEMGKDILVYGGPTFASSLIKDGLIDEFHLFVNPTAVGVGRSMFKDIDSKVELNLMGATPYDCGVVVLKYSRKNDCGGSLPSEA